MCCDSNPWEARRCGNPGDYPARRARPEAVDGEFEVYLRVCSGCAAGFKWSAVGFSRRCRADALCNR